MGPEQKHNVSRDQIKRAASVLREGRLVAFPTETVYGLGANALDSDAVARIFAAKGRPHNSPLIVHVSSIEMARELAGEWPEAADRFTQQFWPGPLTLVLKKKPVIPDVVTAGLPSVGLRMPSHPVAMALLLEAGIPIAAPRANRFTHLSPTTAEHVRQGLGDRIDYILDGGPCGVGIESTVLSLVAWPPVLLRPGGVSRTQLESIVGPLATPASTPEETAHPSPGMHPQHYSPRTPLHLVAQGRLPAEGEGAYLQLSAHPSRNAKTVVMPSDPQQYAVRLYAVLHDLDRSNYDWIAVDTPEDNPAWEGVLDRLRRASVR